MQLAPSHLYEATEACVGLSADFAMAFGSESLWMWECMSERVEKDRFYLSCLFGGGWLVGFVLGDIGGLVIIGMSKKRDRGGEEG